ncbi:hypothetical protein Tco_0285259 [Tanacetum coccineum]
MEELTVDFRKINMDDVRRSYYAEVKSIKSSKINYDRTYPESSNRPTNLKDKFEQCLKESSERQVKRRILEENKEPTTTPDKPKQQLQKVVSHEIKESPTHYSVTRQNKLPPKETDPESFILPCIIGNHSMSNALADLGAIILDIMEDENVPIILGRPMLETAHAKIDVYGKKISLGVGNDQVVFNINKKESPAFISPICVINEVGKMKELNDLAMNDEKVREFGNYLSSEYGSHDIISLSPSELAEDKEEFSMTLGDPDKRMSIGLEEFVDIDDMWDDLDPGILSNEKATTKFLKSGDRIHLLSLDNLQLSCKIGFVSFNSYFVPQTPFNIISRKAYNSIMNHEIMYSGINVVGLAKNLRVFIENHPFLVDFIILENISEFGEKGLTEVLFGQPFKEQIGLVEDWGKGTLWFKIGNDKQYFICRELKKPLGN